MSFLLKRVIAFSDDEDENANAWPSSPSKRRSRSLHLTKSSVPATPIFTKLDDGEDNSESAGKENNQGYRGTVGKAAGPQTITPPLTPTRRSPRKSPRFGLEGPGTENSEANQQQVPSTPKRRSRMVTPGSPSCSTIRDSNNSTGLTPALNRILRPSKDMVLQENASTKPLDQETVETRAKGYSTPKRLSRTRSCLEQSITPLPAIQRTLSGSILKSTETKSPSTSAPTSSSTVLGFYQDAKALFRRTTEPHRLVGRATERETIRTFCRDHVLSPTAGSLYVSGQPGTGKTALLKEVMKEMELEMEEASHDIRVMTINCMTVKDPRLVYHKMLEELGHKTISSEKDAAMKAVESLVLDRKSKVIYVTILDEIDQLLTKDQEVLYKLFEWSCTENSRLTLIGIANALDMTDRFLPRLKARNCEPQLLNFNPYQVAEIREIIMDRLFSLQESDQGNAEQGEKDGKAAASRPRVAPLMQRPAIELCARKVAAATGDLRKALDICRQTIEMVELETKKKERQQQISTTPALSGKVMPLQEISLAELENRMAGGATWTPPTRSAPSGLPSSESSESVYPNEGTTTLQEAPKVTVEHVKRALASAFGSPMVQKMKALNLHQKIVLAVLVMKIQGGKTIDCEVGKVFDHYTAVCRSSNKIGAVNRGEYQDLINMLEANGLVTLGKAKEERLRKLGLVPREGEVLDAIKGQDIVDTILNKAGVKLADGQYM